MNASWHVLLCWSGRERLLASALCTAASNEIEGFCPSYVARWWRGGRVRSRVLPLIAGVVFARWEDGRADLWHLARRAKAPGCFRESDVIGIAGGERPAVIPVEGTFARWLASASDEWVVPDSELAALKRGYGAGDVVMVDHRGLRGMLARVESVDDRSLMVVVRYELLGRPQRAVVPTRAVSAREGVVA